MEAQKSPGNGKTAPGMIFVIDTVSGENHPSQRENIPA